MKHPLPTRLTTSVLGFMITLGAVSGCSQPTSAQSTTAATADAAGLVKAQHPQCDVGRKVLNYLATGDNGGDPQLDVLLSKYVGADAPQARAVADQQIQECDTNLSKQEAAQAAATAAAKASASAAAVRAAQETREAAAKAALDAAKDKSCTAIGGHYDDIWNWCASTVKGNPSGKPGADCSHAEVAFNQTDGSLADWSSSSAKETWPGCFRL